MCCNGMFKLCLCSVGTPISKKRMSVTYMEMCSMASKSVSGLRERCLHSGISRHPVKNVRGRNDIVM